MESGFGNRRSVGRIVANVSARAARSRRTSAGVAGTVAALALLAAAASAGAQAINIKNNCSFPIWIDQTPNGGFSPLAGSGLGPAGKLDNNQQGSFAIPANGWGGRFWPKVGCDANGANCLAGSSVSGCPATGCEPPGDTKVEFFYDPLSSNKRPFYDVSLVDGYTLPAKITPSKSDGGRCTPTNCNVEPTACPTDERDVGNLQVVKEGKVVQCLAPCKKWNFPPPYGMNKSEQQPPGNYLCCPTPPISPNECRSNIVVQTKYVNLVRNKCPSAYSYSYDDLGGSHDCPPGTSFDVVFCP